MRLTEEATPDADEVVRLADLVLRDIIADADSAYRTAPTLFQDFTVRCRMRGLTQPPLDLPEFTRRLSMARAGIFATVYISIMGHAAGLGYMGSHAWLRSKTPAGQPIPSAVQGSASAQG